MTPIFNWKEIESLLGHFQAQGTHVTRVSVPERSGFTGRFQKNEWCIELKSRQTAVWLVFCVRAQRPYFYFTRKQAPKALNQATQSVFGLSLSKSLEGATFQEVELPARERTFCIWFENQNKKRIALVLNLIPAAAEALLVDAGWNILARTKTKALCRYEFPKGSSERADMAIQTSEVEDPESLSRFIEKELRGEAQGQKVQSLSTHLKAVIKKSQSALKEAQLTLTKMEKDPDWKHYGDLLKASIHLKPKAEKGKIRVEDYSLGGMIEIPVDPKFTLQEQIEKFYQQSKRSKRKIEDAEDKKKTAQEKLAKLEPLLKALASPTLSLETTRSIELALSLGSDTAKTPTHKKVKKMWDGKIFTSQDGTTLLVGKSLKENLELTFKVARGNDMWLHVRGKPSSHAIIVLNPGKSPSLDTLLDAAQLVLHYSGGNNWGKTEMDYTFRKYVKRIKNSDQVSYTQNKTLIIEHDRKRLDRVLKSAD